MKPNIYKLTTECGLDLYIIAESWTMAYDIMTRNHPDLNVVRAQNISLGSEVMIGV